jgi:hypothetical protein
MEMKVGFTGEIMIMMMMRLLGERARIMNVMRAWASTLEDDGIIFD